MTKAQLETIARDAGFDAVGVGPAVRAPHAEAFHRWLAGGFHASMEWMARDPEQRCQPALLLPDARSVIALAVNYFVRDEIADKIGTGTTGTKLRAFGDAAHSGQVSSFPKTQDGADASLGLLDVAPSRPNFMPCKTGATDGARGKIARYARGRDYHNFIPKRLKAIDRALAAEGGVQRCFMDSGPLLERDFAVLSGIAWHGKSSLALHPKLGTWFFLAAVITTLAFEPDQSENAPESGSQCHGRSALEIEPSPTMAGRCGSCTRCLDACPTAAIVAPYQVDARRCISYWTIEHKGALPQWIRPLLGNRIFGCDDCLDACPWNRFATASRDASLEVRPSSHLLLRDYLALDEPGFRRLFEGSPVRRAGHQGFLRNVCTALGNVGSAADLEALDRCAAGTDQIIAEHAIWAAEKIRRSKSS